MNASDLVDICAAYHSVVEITDHLICISKSDQILTESERECVKHTLDRFTAIESRLEEIIDKAYAGVKEVS